MGESGVLHSAKCLVTGQALQVGQPTDLLVWLGTMDLLEYSKHPSQTHACTRSLAQSLNAVVTGGEVAGLSLCHMLGAA